MGTTVGEPAAPLVQFRFVVYCVNLLILPAAICSTTVVTTPEDKVATALPKGPAPAPVDVAVASMLELLVARMLYVNWSAALARAPLITLLAVIVEYCRANIMPCSPPATSWTFTVVGLKLPII